MWPGVEEGTDSTSRLRLRDSRVSSAQRDEEHLGAFIACHFGVLVARTGDRSCITIRSITTARETFLACRAIDIA